MFKVFKLQKLHKQAQALIDQHDFLGNIIPVTFISDSTLLLPFNMSVLSDSIIVGTNQTKMYTQIAGSMELMFIADEQIINICLNSVYTIAIHLKIEPIDYLKQIIDFIDRHIRTMMHTIPGITLAMNA